MKTEIASEPPREVSPAAAVSGETGLGLMEMILRCDERSGQPVYGIS